MASQKKQAGAEAPVVSVEDLGEKPGAIDADAQLAGTARPARAIGADAADWLADERAGGASAPIPADLTAEEVAAAFEAAVLGEPVAVEATTIDTDLADVLETPVRRSPHAADLGDQTGLEETIVSSAPQWTGTFLTVDDVLVRLPNGKPAHRDVVRHPGAVAIIALTENNKLVLVHQYRTSLEQVTVEIPAGKLEPGEDPAQAAARELAEETGYEAAQLAYLGPLAVAAGYSDEILHLYMAMGLTFVGARPDADEFVNVDLVDLDVAIDQVLDGKIIDSKTVAGILLCDSILRRMAM